MFGDYNHIEYNGFRYIKLRVGVPAFKRGRAEFAGFSSEPGSAQSRVIPSSFVMDLSVPARRIHI